MGTRMMREDSFLLGNLEQQSDRSAASEKVLNEVISKVVREIDLIFQNDQDHQDLDTATEQAAGGL